MPPIASSEHRASTGSVAWARVLHQVFGALLLIFGAWLLWGFPIGRPWLLGLAVALAVAQSLESRTWLVAVPMLFATVDLGAWSGRFLLSEQDALLAILVGSALAAGHYEQSGRQLLRGTFAPLWLLVAALAVGFVRGFEPVQALDANAWNGYLTGWNAVRIAKGPLWALILWPLLARQLDENRQKTEFKFALGMVVALLGFGTFVLWERGLASDLMTAKNIWGLFGTWLNLSGSYRITGPFSQMQLGGEAVDGFLTLSWPFALLLLFQARRWPIVVLALCALALAAYGVMVTFTRTTYAAVAVAVLVYGAAVMSGASAGQRGRLAAAIVFAVTAAALFVHGFHLGGVLTTVGYLIIVLGVLGTMMFVQRRGSWLLPAVAITVLLAVGGSIALHGILSSQWTRVAPRMADATVAVSVALLGAGAIVAGALLRPWARTRAGAAALLSLAVFLPVVTLSFSGFQIEKRFSTVNQDLAGRLLHWRETLTLMPDTIKATVFGMGLGRFPLTKLLAAEVPTGTWYFGREGGQPFLRLLGTASLCYGQRVVGLEPGTYRLEVGLRNPSQKNAILTVKLQPRHLLESELWQPQTEQITLAIGPDSSWQRMQGDLHLTESSAPPWYDPRFSVLALTNQGDSLSAVDVAYVRLIDSAGRDRVDNGTFAAGADRWFAYNDFQHLEWHTKNFYVALFFDMGALGLLSFALVCFIALLRGWRRAQQAFPFGAASVASLAGFLTLGATGTLFDVPQLMTLFLLIVTAMLWRPVSTQSRSPRRQANAVPAPDVNQRTNHR